MISVRISGDTCPGSKMEWLLDEISENTRSSPEFTVVYPNIQSTIEEFSERARVLARTGTTIRMTRDYQLPESTTVQVILEYPRRPGLFGKLATILNGRK